MICTIEGCNRGAIARTWCKAHYHRWQAHGDPRAGLPMRTATVEERYFNRVDVRGGDECWPWLGGLSEGYGKMNVGDRRTRPAHQLAWEFANKCEFPAGLVADHLCHNADLECPGGPKDCLHRRCQNPAHIQPATISDNVIAGVERRHARDHNE